MLARCTLPSMFLTRTVATLTVLVLISSYGHHVDAWMSSHVQISPHGGALRPRCSMPRASAGSMLRQRKNVAQVKCSADQPNTSASAANDAVKQRLQELERLRSSIANRKGLDNVAAAESAAQKAAEQAAKMKEAAELNAKLEAIMEKKRAENQQRLTRAQAKRNMAGLKAITKQHTENYKRMQEIRRNTETVDAVLGIRRGTTSAFITPESLWEKLPDELKTTFRFSRVVGRGSFGVVVLAEKEEESLWMDNCDITGRKLQCDDDGTTKVAVKLLQPRKGEEPIAMREGLVLATIGAVEDSPLVPKCLDYGISNGIVYIVLEYYDGISLEQVVEDEGPLSVEETARVGAQVAQALGVIHRAGFVYRDVKPENILRCGVGEDAVYRLIDFGSTTGIGGCLFGASSSSSSLALGSSSGSTSSVLSQATSSRSTDQLSQPNPSLPAQDDDDDDVYSDILQGLGGGGGAGGEEGGSDDAYSPSRLSTSSESSEDENCRLDSYGAETQERLLQVFRSVDKNGDGCISEEEIAECFQAVGIKEDLARSSSKRIMTKLSVSAEGNIEMAAVPKNEITETQFLDLYGELVREQDRAAPVGTFAFMAPEQLLVQPQQQQQQQSDAIQAGSGKGAIDLGASSPLTDIYSLGVTLYALASDRLPQQPSDELPPGASIEEQRSSWSRLFAADFEKPLPDLTSVRADAPEDLVAVISKAVEKKPWKRWGDAAGMEQSLVKIVRRLQTERM